MTLKLLVIFFTFNFILFPTSHSLQLTWQFSKWYFEKTWTISIITEADDEDVSPLYRMIHEDDGITKPTNSYNGNVFPPRWYRPSVTSVAETAGVGYLVLAVTEPWILTVVERIAESSNRANTVVHVLNPSLDPEIILKYAWERGVLNIVVLYGHSVHLYNPFEMNEAGGRGAMHEIALRSDTVLQKIPSIEAALDDRLRNMHDYPIKVIIFDMQSISEPVYNENGTIVRYAGMDGWVLSLLSERMHFRPDMSTFYGTGRYVRSVENIENGYAEIAANMRLVKIYATTSVIFSNMLQDTRTCYISPKYYPPAATIPLTPPIDGYTWMMTGFAIVITSVLWYYVKLFTEEASFLIVLQDTALIVVMASPTIGPNTIQDRIIFACLAYLGILIVGVYQGAILTQLTAPPPSIDINTLQQLDESNLGVGVGASLEQRSPNEYRHPSDNDESSPYERLLEREVSFANIDELLAAAVNGSYAVLLPELFVDFFQNTYYSKDTGLDLFHKVRECARSYYSAYMTHRNCSYIDRIDYIISIIHSSGLTKKWRSDTVYNMTLTRLVRTRYHEDSGPQAFKLSYFWKVFTFWGVFVLLSVLVFLGELAFANDRNDKS